MSDSDLAPRHSLKRSRPALLALAVAAAVGGGIWYWRRGGAPGSPPATEAPTAAATPEPGLGLPATGAPAAPAAPADARALLEAASADAAYRRWLAEGGLVERWAAVTENLASGESPRAHLAFLRPAARFSVVERGGKSVIAPSSYGRYDAFADAIATLDAPALARAYRALHPALEGAFGALGYASGSLDRATERALQRIVQAPVVDGDVAVVDEGGVYLFEDEALERRGDVDKHLLRMGPRNTRLLQRKAREILAALGLPPAVTRPAAAR